MVQREATVMKRRRMETAVEQSLVILTIYSQIQELHGGSVRGADVSGSIIPVCLSNQDVIHN